MIKVKYYHLLLVFFVSACATYKTQINDIGTLEYPDKELVHTFYLIGDAGSSTINNLAQGVQGFKKELNKANKHSTAIFLGDNIYPKGLPKKGAKGRSLAAYQLDTQINTVANFKGQTIFIPGNHDWYSNGLKGLKRQERYVEKALGKNTFLPENGCPIETVEVATSISVIIIDTEWYLTNWDKHPTINDDCEIKTREKFFETLEDEIKKARGKTTIIALHHPMFTNGPHGGFYDLKSHMKPLPVLGSIKNVLRRITGISPADLQNKKYNTLKKRIVTLAQENDKVIFVSGHEHSLQYIKQDNLHQIISGSGSKSTATKNKKHHFSSSVSGFARLDVFKDGSSFVRFYNAKTNQVIYQTEVLPPLKVPLKNEYNIGQVPKTVKASIYTKDEVTKSAVFKALWGSRYRKYYGTNVSVSTVNLDTLYGGLKLLKLGGGHQSKSLHFINKQGKRYVMRAMRKSATVYLQAIAFKDQYIEGQFENSLVEDVLLDFYTGSHPYAPFVSGVLSDAVNLYHTNPVLFYVPKQSVLGPYNTIHGDALYMIEEHVSSGHNNLDSFGKPDDIKSTDKLVEHLRKDENYTIDANTYLRARLFDMVIADWDRHLDQWRWAAFKNNETNTTIYKPIPRDRDQVFSKMGDGSLMQVLTRIVPSLKLLEGFAPSIRNIKGYNSRPFFLDMMLLNKTEKHEWDTQVALIQKQLTAQVIDKAFKQFPKEVQDESLVKMKKTLWSRIQGLPRVAKTYYNIINKAPIITGTDKNDLFEIQRLPEGKTRIVGTRLAKGKKTKVFFNKTYSKQSTKEIWIYSLDGQDTFRVYGKGSPYIKLKLIGGQNNDTYKIDNGAKVKLYDYKSKKNEITTNKGAAKLTDNYNANMYNFLKAKHSTNQIMPVLGANPDDGFKIGFVNTFTNYGFVRQPFSSQHSIAAAYYHATSGYDLKYTGEFANVIKRWSLGITAAFTSPNYSVNFFGYGNSTSNLNVSDSRNFNRDYNRVRYSTLALSPSLNWRSKLDAHFKWSLHYESIDVEETTGRFVNTFFQDNGAETHQRFFGTDALYTYQNKDNIAYPTLGMQTSILLGYKTNINDNRGFGYLVPELGIDYRLDRTRRLVLASKVKAHINFGNAFQFYQSASIGGNDGLRGYRNQRFSGKQSFYQTTDLRFSFKTIKTNLFPLSLGVYTGFDYGRVWVNNNLVLDAPRLSNSNRWNTSIGGGVFANAANKLIFNLSSFNSKDGLRVAFNLGFGF